MMTMMTMGMTMSSKSCSWIATTHKTRGLKRTLNLKEGMTSLMIALSLTLLTEIKVLTDRALVPDSYNGEHTASITAHSIMDL